MRHILMPRLGLTMEEGTLASWQKKEGDSFAEGEPVAEVETDKVTSPVEATFSGRLTRILVQPGATVKVLTPIAEADPTGE